MAIEVGSKYEGKVTGITHFGAFVLLPDGVTGLVHISEVADHYVENIHDVLKVNDVVTVKVLNVAADGKIGLSIKKAKDPVESGVAPSRPHRRADGGGSYGRSPGSGRSGSGRMTFDDKLSRFLKDSEDRLSSLRKQDSKRGGRGGRRD